MVNFCKPPEKDGTYTPIPPLPLAYRHPPGVVSLCIATCKLYLVVVAFAFIVNNKTLVMQIFKFGHISQSDIDHLISQKWERYGVYLVSPCGKYEVNLVQNKLSIISKDALALRMISIYTRFGGVALAPEMWLGLYFSYKRNTAAATN